MKRWIEVSPYSGIEEDVLQTKQGVVTFGLGVDHPDRPAVVSRVCSQKHRKRKERFV